MSPTSPSPDFDAIVVGARCAGAATAMLLARRGLRVLVVDRGAPGDDALSTHALMRGGVLQLQRWGVLDQVIAAGTPPVRTTTFHYGDEVVPVPIKAGGGIDALYAPRRNVLDPILVAAARAAGAVVRHGVRVVDLLRGPGDRVEGVVLAGPGGVTSEVRASIVIGADGLGSVVARRTGAAAYRVGRHASATIYAHWCGLEDRGYHWYFRPGASAGVIPTGDGLTCVFAAAPARRFRDGLRHHLEAGYRRVLAEAAPEMSEALGRATASPARPFAGVPGFLRTAAGDGWALVGDAGYFKDPLTAHGMTDALRDAELLADAITAGTLAGYQEERDALSVPLFEVTDEIASFEWDQASIRGLHRRLSEAMKPEVAMLEQSADQGALRRRSSPCWVAATASSTPSPV